MNRTVTVKPKSSKSKNRLCNIMDGNPVCVVEQESKLVRIVSRITANTFSERSCFGKHQHWRMSKNYFCWQHSQPQLG
jgi:hypothetical protein